MIKEIQIAKCSNCGKIRNSEDYKGGFIWDTNWLKLSLNSYSRDDKLVFEGNYWLFCTRRCLVGYLAKEDKTKKTV